MVLHGPSATFCCAIAACVALVGVGVGLLLWGQEVPAVGDMVDVALVVVVIVLVVLGFGASTCRSHVKGLCFSYAGTGLGGGGGGEGSVGFQGGLFVLVGGFGLLEDIDNMLALVNNRIEYARYVSVCT